MSVFTTNRAATVTATSYFSTIVAALAAWNDARVTRKSLSKLSDRELDDIGLSRGDIDSVVAAR